MAYSYMFEGQLSTAEEMYQWAERRSGTEFLIQQGFIRDYDESFENDAALLTEIFSVTVDREEGKKDTSDLAVHGYPLYAENVNIANKKDTWASRKGLTWFQIQKGLYLQVRCGEDSQVGKEAIRPLPWGVGLGKPTTRFRGRGWVPSVRASWMNG